MFDVIQDGRWNMMETAGFAKMVKHVAEVMAVARPELLKVTPNEILLQGMIEMAGTMITLDESLSPEVCADLSYVQGILSSAREVLAELRTTNALAV